MTFLYGKQISYDNQTNYCFTGKVNAKVTQIATDNNFLPPIGFSVSTGDNSVTSPSYTSFVSLILNPKDSHKCSRSCPITNLQTNEKITDVRTFGSQIIFKIFDAFEQTQVFNFLPNLFTNSTSKIFH